MSRTLAALTVAAGCIAGVARGADADLSALQQRIDRLEGLTERVEAVSAIKRLQHAYGHYSELGLWHDFADLFADTGIGHYTTGALDREAIRAVRAATSRGVTAAGGVTTQEEVDWLDSLGVNAVAGMAIYTGRLKI